MISLKVMNMLYVPITNYIRKTRLQMIEKNIVQKFESILIFK